jgi:CBS domain-containing protein
MLVREAMTRRIEGIAATATVSQAARQMSENGLGFLPVLAGNSIVGVVTDRDLTVRVMAQGLNPIQVRMKEVMTPRVVCCRDEDSLKTAARLMVKERVRRLVVLNREGTLCGIISVDDLAVAAPQSAVVNPPERPAATP